MSLTYDELIEVGRAQILGLANGDVFNDLTAEDVPNLDPAEIENWFDWTYRDEGGWDGFVAETCAS